MRGLRQRMSRDVIPGEDLQSWVDGRQTAKLDGQVSDGDVLFHLQQVLHGLVQCGVRFPRHSRTLDGGILPKKENSGKFIIQKIEIKQTTEKPTGNLHKQHAHFPIGT